MIFGIQKRDEAVFKEMIKARKLILSIKELPGYPWTVTVTIVIIVNPRNISHGAKIPSREERKNGPPD